jgi:hypothetical protein
VPKPLLDRPRQTLKQLQDLQRLTANVIMQPLAAGFRTSLKFTDGRLNSTVAAGFIKANDRLTPIERIGIYNKQYWYRLIDIMYEDYPGLAIILGRLKFNKLTQAYLMKYPSNTFALRNLGDRLEKFIRENPKYTEPKTQLCQEMVSFEWAQVVAFDGPANPPLGIDDLLGSKPTKLRLAIQPYISLLHLHWPLDDFTIALKQSAMRGEASNAVDAPSQKPQKKVKAPRKQEIFVAVHRLNNDLYYKRLDRSAYLLLTYLHKGKTLAGAVDATLKDVNEGDWTSKIQTWFQSWTEMGWFCKYK